MIYAVIDCPSSHDGRDYRSVDLMYGLYQPSGIETTFVDSSRFGVV